MFGDIAFQGTGLTNLFFTGDVVPTIVKEDSDQMGAFRNVDATKLTIHYPSTWTSVQIEDLKQKIADSGMKNVDDTHPAYEKGSPTVTPSLLDAARLFGL